MTCGVWLTARKDFSPIALWADVLRVAPGLRCDTGNNVYDWP
jgi:hypothetical protein